MGSYSPAARVYTPWREHFHFFISPGNDNRFPFACVCAAWCRRSGAFPLAAHRSITHKPVPPRSQRPTRNCSNTSVSADLNFFTCSYTLRSSSLRRKYCGRSAPGSHAGCSPFCCDYFSIVFVSVIVNSRTWCFSLAPSKSGIGILIVLTGVPGYFFFGRPRPPVLRNGISEVCSPTQTAVSWPSGLHSPLLGQPYRTLVSQRCTTR